MLTVSLVNNCRLNDVEYYLDLTGQDSRIFSLQDECEVFCTPSQICQSYFLSY